MSDVILLGVHCSISGGLENAVKEAERLGINTFQIFTKNQRQWREKIYSESEGNLFKSLLQKAKIKIAFSHTSYLINLGTADPLHRENSILALVGEITRCHILGLPYCILHPGAGKGAEEKETIDKISKALIIALNYTNQYNVSVLLENTAGQGTSIGGQIYQLDKIMQQVGSPRLGMCLDTCHAFVAGYDIRTETGTEKLFKEIDLYVGLKNLKAIHLNDSKGELGSKLDRHAHIGEGKLGILPFTYIINSFPDIPKVLETDKENNMDIQNIAKLRSLVKY